MSGNGVSGDGRGAGMRVSVLITNYNYGAFLDACLASVAAQTLPAHEVIVVDDGSTDDSRDRLRRVGHHVKVILQEQRGQAGAIDTAVAASDGDILCLLDSDDILMPTKLQRVAELFRQRPEVEWVRHCLELVDNRMVPLGARVPPVIRNGPILPHRGLMAERVVTAATSGIVLRRSLAMRVFPLAPTSGEAFRLARDADALLLGRIARANARGFTMNEVLALYRRHEQQLYPSSDNITKLIERQIEIARAVAAEFGEPYTSGMLPSPCHKHAMILESLRGIGRFRSSRARSWIRGSRAIAASLWNRPAAAARQLAALTFAFVAPGTWLRRFHRGQGWST